MDNLSTRTKHLKAVSASPWTKGLWTAGWLGAALLLSQNLAFSSESAKVVPAPVSDEQAAPPATRKPQCLPAAVSGACKGCSSMSAA
jgi:hypothetical protein